MTRKMLVSVLSAAVTVLVTAMPAAAQSQDQTTVPPVPQFQVAASFLPDASAPAADTTTFDDQAGPKTHTMGDRQVFVRIDGGLIFCCSNTGFVVGVTVSAQPKSVKNLEVEGGFGLGRFDGVNLFDFSADGLYDFHIQGQGMMPFAGAGLGVTHFGDNGGTHAGFELLGGVQLPVSGPHVVRVEVKFLFTSVTSTLLLGSYSF